MTEPFAAISAPCARVFRLRATSSRSLPLSTTQSLTASTSSRSISSVLRSRLAMSCCGTGFFERGIDETSIFSFDAPIEICRRRLFLSFFSTHQLDQVLELVRLRVEVVDQEGLELLCEWLFFGERRGRGSARERKG